MSNSTGILAQAGLEPKPCGKLRAIFLISQTPKPGSALSSWGLAKEPVDSRDSLLVLEDPASLAVDGLSSAVAS